MMGFLMLPHRCPKCRSLGLRYRWDHDGVATIIMARMCPHCGQKLGPPDARK